LPIPLILHPLVMYPFSSFGVRVADPDPDSVGMIQSAEGEWVSKSKRSVTYSWWTWKVS